MKHATHTLTGRSRQRLTLLAGIPGLAWLILPGLWASEARGAMPEPDAPSSQPSPAVPSSPAASSPARLRAVPREVDLEVLLTRALLFLEQGSYGRAKEEASLVLEGLERLEALGAEVKIDQAFAQDLREQALWYRGLACARDQDTTCALFNLEALARSASARFPGLPEELAALYVAQGKLSEALAWQARAKAGASEAGAVPDLSIPSSGASAASGKGAGKAGVSGKGGERTWRLEAALGAGFDTNAASASTEGSEGLCPAYSLGEWALSNVCGPLISGRLNVRWRPRLGKESPLTLGYLFQTRQYVEEELVPFDTSSHRLQATYSLPHGLSVGYRGDVTTLARQLTEPWLQAHMGRVRLEGERERWAGFAEYRAGYERFGDLSSLWEDMQAASETPVSCPEGGVSAEGGSSQESVSLLCTAGRSGLKLSGEAGGRLRSGPVELRGQVGLDWQRTRDTRFTNLQGYGRLEVGIGLPKQLSLRPAFQLSWQRYPAPQLPWTVLRLQPGVGLRVPLTAKAGLWAFYGMTWGQVTDRSAQSASRYWRQLPAVEVSYVF